MRTAGSTATVLAVPPLLFFLTFDEGNDFAPFSAETVLVVSAVAWIVLHLVGPAAGRTFPLAAGAIAGWLAVLHLVEDDLSSPFDLLLVLWFAIGFAFADPVDGFGFGSAFGGPDLETLGILTLAIGAALVVLGHRADRAGQAARATAFAAAAVVVVPFGPLLLVDAMEPAGSGFLLVVCGTALAASGALRGRRGTTWSGAGFVVAGLLLVLTDLAGESTASFGVAAAVVGALVVLAGFLVSTGLDEPDELTPGPSTFTTSRPSPLPPAEPPLPPPAA